MKKGQVYEGVVERVDFPNKAIVRVGEETCVVKNGLPGQKLSFLVNKQRKGKAEGRLLKVLETSPSECGSPCSHFGVCGGCTYLSLPYEAQLKVKEEQVKKLLDGVLAGQQSPYRFEGIKPSPRPYEYRNKMEFSFGDEVKDGPLALGMHKRGSFYDVVTVQDCRIVDEDYRKILEAVKDYFADRNVSFFHRLTHEGYLRHLLVRKASKTGEILVALVTTSQIPYKANADTELTEEELIAGFSALLQGLSLNGSLAGILHILNDSIADVVQSDETRILYGRDFFYEELLGLKFKISAFSFFQTNSLGAEVLYSTAREYIGELGGEKGSPDKVVFDLYSGTGTIAQLMAPVSKKVIGVEIVEEAVEAARKNAELNGLTNCEFIAGDVLKVLDEITEKPDFIILDPPRDGIHPKALPKILAYGVERILYISCKPTSLVRDLQVFLDNGYQVERAVAVDQFPFTANVECVVMMHKNMDSYEKDMNMEKRRLGKTNLMVSEIGFGGEWLERHPEEESVELLRYAGEKGVNIIDCWMPDPKSRDIIGKAMLGKREQWYVQGHIGSTWQDGQYVRSREMKYVKPAFEDLLARLQTDYIDLGMIHYVDSMEDWNHIMNSEFIDYVNELKESGKIRHIGLSSHNPQIAKLAARSGFIEMILFSINPAFDMFPASENIDDLFAEEYDRELTGIDPDRVELYQLCEQNDVGITVMKGFAGGRLFDEKRSPFGVSLTPIQCIHYALTRPAVSSILCGYDTKEQVDAALAYETASTEEKDYASVIANAPFHSYRGECTYCGHCKPCVVNLDIAMINKYYDLATMQPEIPATVKSHYMLLEHKASECISCHACESRCPFEVPIAEKMEKTAKLFGC